MASVDEGRRAVVSCDSCRARKVKCVRLQNGSCQRCVKIGRGCSSGKVKSSRPYYQTSKEQFELMSMVVRHFLPDASLERDELREVVASIVSQGQQQCQQNGAQSRPLDGQETRQEVHTTLGRKRKANGREDERRQKRQSGVARTVFESVEAEADERLAQEGEQVDGQGEIEEVVEDGQDEEAGARDVQEEEGDEEDEENEEFADGRYEDPGEEERDGQENSGGEVFGGFRQDQYLGDVGVPDRQSTESRPEISAVQSVCQTQAQIRAGHSHSGQPVSFLSPPCVDSPCSSVSDDNLIVHDAMQIPRFHNGSCYGTFYSKIVTNLAFTHARLLRGQASVNSHIIDGNTIGVAYPHNLPARQQIEIAATRFFAEVNNVAYILKYEQVQTTLDNIYSCGLSFTRSSLAIVYLILSCGQDSDHFYTEGCRYSTAALEEGTLESVQALMLMALCCLNRSQLNLAWVTVGSALRIAQSIGLHMHESNWGEESSFKIECKKRLWWSLFDLETIIACTLGRPPGVHEHQCRVSTASNTEFDMNPYTPPGYTRASVSLGKLFNRSIRTIYQDNPAPVHPDTTVDELLNSLQEWWNDLPAWLRPNSSIPPSHIRAVSHLNLRYYHILSHLTRQYLLSSTTNPASCTPELIRRAGICENANTQSILLLRELHRKELISSINFFDALYIIGNGAIIFLRCLRNPSLELMAEVEKTLPMVSLVDHLALGKAALKSLQGLLQDLRSYCDLQHDQYFATGDVGAAIVDLNLDGAMFDFWDNALMWQQEKPEMNSINNFGV